MTMTAAALQDLAPACRRALLATATVRGKRLSCQARRLAILIVETSFALGRPTVWMATYWPIQTALGIDSKEASLAIKRLTGAEMLTVEARDGGWEFGLRPGELLEGTATLERAAAWAELMAGRRPQSPELLPAHPDERRDAGFALAMGEADLERAAAATAVAEIDTAPQLQASLQRMRRTHAQRSAEPEPGARPPAPMPAEPRGRFPQRSLGEIPPAGGDSPSRTRAYPTTTSCTSRTSSSNITSCSSSSWPAAANRGTAAMAEPMKRFGDPFRQHVFTRLEDLVLEKGRPTDREEWQVDTGRGAGRHTWLARVAKSPQVVDQALGEIGEIYADPRAERPRKLLAMLYASCQRVARSVGAVFRLFSL